MRFVRARRTAAPLLRPYGPIAEDGSGMVISKREIRRLQQEQRKRRRARGPGDAAALEQAEAKRERRRTRNLEAK